MQIKYKILKYAKRDEKQIDIQAEKDVNFENLQK